MLKRTTSLSFFAALFLICAGSPRLAGAQAMMESDPNEEEIVEAPVSDDPDAPRHGVGLRLRYVFVPKALIEVFVEEAASGMGQPGFGFDYVRRKKEFEISVGFEYDSLNPSDTDGYYVERGGSTSELGTVDRVQFDNLSWMSIDASIVYHHELSELVALRYGGGLGLGIVSGEITTTDGGCIGNDAQTDCAPLPGAPAEKEDFFRFPPVFNLIGGVQLTPGDNIAINFEIGMRTVFYSGVGAQYFF